MILTGIGVVVLLGWTGIGVYLLSKRQAHEAYQRGFRDGLKYGLQHKAKKEAKKVKDEAKGNHSGS